MLHDEAPTRPLLSDARSRTKALTILRSRKPSRSPPLTRDAEPMPRKGFRPPSRTSCLLPRCPQTPHRDSSSICGEGRVRTRQSPTGRWRCCCCSCKSICTKGR
ncbi:hypothetical protein BKA80DRAFT_276867 [Phyllosticta citrichinensis]